MTTFWRDGFWRTNAYGTTHWVDGHQVERYNWDRATEDPGYLTFLSERLAELRADCRTTARFATPNANCPVCGEAVFFYRNEHGSRVYFDELGPPWPKHPCTVTDAPVTLLPGDLSNVFPSLRPVDQRNHVTSLLASSAREPDHEFWQKYGTSPWGAWRIDGRFSSRPGTLLALASLDSISRRRVFVASRALPRALCQGIPVFLYKNWLSFFDVQSQLPAEVQVEKFSSASTFVSRLLGAASDA